MLLPLTPTRVVPFVSALASHGERPALVTDDGVVAYAVLAEQVAAFAQRLGQARRLVLIEGGNDPAALVSYLGALAAGCPVLLVPPGERAGAWIEGYDPDVVVTAGELVERRALSAHDLHPDLALLLTTSGSTGSAKLVRLSHDNLQANAEAVADAVGVRPDDRALTTLPLHYSYGLSVVHSHLLRGAALVLTGLSVVDLCFWELAATAGATSFAGVPYTFDLLDRVGFSERDLPSLRYVSCAGGRLAPDRVRHWAQVGRRRGWDLVVMYGQTEATARIAVLPAALALEHPDAVGRPVPGTAVRVEEGEVVVTGPGVMLGYAEDPADLALGRTVETLHTGDLGTIGPDGLLRLTGRRRRIAKVLGLRVDLAHVEAVLGREGTVACCAELDGALLVAADGNGDDRELGRRAAQVAGLPARAVRAAHLGELPRLASGKPDAGRAIALVPAVRPTALTGDLLVLYADVLDRDDLTDADSFVSAGGDSLSYVELSLRLEDVLGQLPPGWHLTSIGDLRPAVWRRRPRLETSVALRAVAIVLVVAFHSNALSIVGGAHLLIGVAGFNLARFGLSLPSRAERLRHLRASAARIAVPTVLWAGAVAVVTGSYGLTTVLQANSVLGPRAWGPAWQLWFVEALLQLLILVALLVAVPALDRAERRRPFGAAAVLVAAGLLLRDVPGVGGPDGIHTSAAVLWLFALGWAAARSTDRWRRLLVSAALLAGLPGFFDDAQRATVVAAGLLALVWLPALRCPTMLRRLAGVLASSSLWIYLTQWQVYPRFEDDRPWLGVLASLVVGIAACRLVQVVGSWVRRYSPARTEDASTHRR